MLNGSEGCSKLGVMLAVEADRFGVEPNIWRANLRGNVLIPQYLSGITWAVSNELATMLPKYSLFDFLSTEPSPRQRLQSGKVINILHRRYGIPAYFPDLNSLPPYLKTFYQEQGQFPSGIHFISSGRIEGLWRQSKVHSLNRILTCLQYIHPGDKNIASIENLTPENSRRFSPKEIIKIELVRKLLEESLETIDLLHQYTSLVNKFLFSPRGKYLSKRYKLCLVLDMFKNGKNDFSFSEDSLNILDKELQRHMLSQGLPFGSNNI